MKNILSIQVYLIFDIFSPAVFFFISIEIVLFSIKQQTLSTVKLFRILTSGLKSYYTGYTEKYLVDPSRSLFLIMAKLEFESVGRDLKQKYLE